MSSSGLVPEAELYERLDNLGLMLTGDGTSETRFWCLKDDPGVEIQVPMPVNGMYDADLVEHLERHIAQYLADQSSS